LRFGAGGSGLCLFVLGFGNFYIGLGLAKGCFRLRLLRRRLIQRGARVRGIDLDQDIAGVDELIVFSENPGHLPTYPGGQPDGAGVDERVVRVLVTTCVPCPNQYADYNDNESYSSSNQQARAMEQGLFIMLIVTGPIVMTISALLVVILTVVTILVLAATIPTRKSRPGRGTLSASCSTVLTSSGPILSGRNAIISSGLAIVIVGPARCIR
jgi:hypothetical protein